MQTKTILHLVYRFDIGGLESVIVNMINTLPDSCGRHVIVSLTDVNPDFAHRLRKDVTFHALHKPPGNSLRLHRQLFALFRTLRPDIVHSYNLATLEYQVTAALAGVKRRIHAEHGRDIYDLDGSNKKYQWLRRLVNPCVQHWVPVSQELADWLVRTVRIPAAKVTRIYNGIDIRRFRPRPEDAPPHPLFGVLTVGRMAPVKDQLTLIKAVEWLVRQEPARRPGLRLVIAGSGELEAQLSAYIAEHGLADCVVLPGAQADVLESLLQADLFVLPSLAEGIALTILEAMACGLPVIGTRVGGTPELVEPDGNGQLYAPRDYQRMAAGIAAYMDDRDLCRRHGTAGRRKVETGFSLEAMTQAYLALYQQNRTI